MARHSAESILLSQSTDVDNDEVLGVESKGNKSSDRLEAGAAGPKKSDRSGWGSCFTWDRDYTLEVDSHDD